jgi:hypothetical protein
MCKNFALIKINYFHTHLNEYTNLSMIEKKTNTGNDAANDVLGKQIAIKE